MMEYRVYIMAFLVAPFSKLAMSYTAHIAQMMHYSYRYDIFQIVDILGINSLIEYHKIMYILLNVFRKVTIRYE